MTWCGTVPLGDARLLAATAASEASATRRTAAREGAGDERHAVTGLNVIGRWCIPLQRGGDGKKAGITCVTPASETATSHGHGHVEADAFASLQPKPGKTLGARCPCHLRFLASCE